MKIVFAFVLIVLCVVLTFVLNIVTCDANERSHISSINRQRPENDEMENENKKLAEKRADKNCARIGYGIAGKGQD